MTPKTNVEKWEATMAELLQDAGRSDRQIAEALGLSVSFVGKVRKKLEADGKVQSDKRRGKDNKVRRPPRNLKIMRGRLLALLKGKRKRRKDIDELAAWIQGMTADQLEKYLAAMEGEKDFASEQPIPNDQPVPTSDEDFLKWGLIAGMVEDQGWTEETAKVAASDVLDQVGTDERPRLIERGKDIGCAPGEPGDEPRSNVLVWNSGSNSLHDPYLPCSICQAGF